MGPRQSSLRSTPHEDGSKRSAPLATLDHPLAKMRQVARRMPAIDRISIGAEVANHRGA
jgi:hypothetical protein